MLRVQVKGPECCFGRSWGSARQVAYESVARASNDGLALPAAGITSRGLVAGLSVSGVMISLGRPP